MHRLFLDANVLFSAAYRADAGVTRLWELEGCVLLTSDYAAEEARRNLTESSQLDRLEHLLGGMEKVPSVTMAPDVRGPIEIREKDWPILGGAVAANATHLVTGDRRDFGPFFGSRLFGVLIVPPADYLASRDGATP